MAKWIEKKGKQNDKLLGAIWNIEFWNMKKLAKKTYGDAGT